MAAREVLVESAESPLEALPDDAVLAVLQYLSPAQLLEARAVCRRWRRLARHPDLWRQRRLEDERGFGFLRHKHLSASQLRAKVRAVLHLAPCAASLSLNSLERLGAAVASTACAVAELFVSVESNSDAVLATLAIRNQAGLGRLRALSVRLVGLADKAETCPAVVGLLGLLAQLHRTEKLTSLTVRWGWDTVVLPGWADSAVPAEPGAASLESLCYQSAELFPHAAFLLRSHAATLTTVSLLDVRRPLGPFAELLGEARGLRSLKCPMPEDMRPLLQCHRLRKLDLYPGSSPETGLAVPYSPAAVEHGKAFFRKATHLRQLTLSEWQQRDIRHQAVSLVGALASSGRAKLRTLALADEFSGVDEAYSADDFRTMNLPGLPALWEILFQVPFDNGMGNVSVALFEVLATQSVPSLHVVDGFAENCLHQLLHEPALTAAIRKNPRLHVLTANLGCGVGDDEQCDACDAEPDDCGHDLDNEDEGCCICGHPEADDAKCRVKAHTDTYHGFWVRVGQEEEQA